MFRVWCYPRFQASTAGLGMYFPRIRGDYCTIEMLTELYPSSSAPESDIDDKFLNSELMLNGLRLVGTFEGDESNLYVGGKS